MMHKDKSRSYEALSLQQKRSKSKQARRKGKDLATMSTQKACEIQMIFVYCARVDFYAFLPKSIFE
jgi:hypothetical protein